MSDASDPEDAIDGTGNESSESDRNDRPDDDRYLIEPGGERRREPERSGRALLIVVFVVAVSLAGGFGFFVGGIGLRSLGPVGLFGVTLFRPTSVGMALYGVTATGFVLGVLYLGARFALRLEDRSSRRD